MTCHHREARPPARINPQNSDDVWLGHRVRGDDAELPRTNIGDPKRCRCVVIKEPNDHCHQIATGEDFRCDYCRGICWVELPDAFAIDIQGTQTAPSCTKPGTVCPDLGLHRD